MSPVTFRRLILILPLLLLTIIPAPARPRAADCQAIQDQLDSLDAQAELLQDDLAKATSAQKPGILKKIKDVQKKIGVADLLLAACQAAQPPQPQPTPVTPARILETDTVNQVPTNIDFKDTDWAKTYVHGEPFMAIANDTTKFEWVPIPNPEVEYDYDDSPPGPSTPAECAGLEAQLASLNNEAQGLQQDAQGASTVQKGQALKKIAEIEKKAAQAQAALYQCLADHPVVVGRQKSPYGLSGWALNPQISSADVPFSHPFLPPDPMKDGFDWEFMVAPDAPYYPLLGGSNKTGAQEHEFAEATDAAHRMGISAQGVLGVETDQNLVPARFRARHGDRVAVFGRWIVDAGHEDFHTEIHPPLLLVAARPGVARPDVTTYSTIVGRPYLVGQRFLGDNEPLRAHLLNEAKKVYTFRSLKIEAHPVIFPKPFAGDLDFDYVVRPAAPRRSQSDAMTVRYHFTVRTGVSVSVTDEGGEGVRVRVSMRSSQYKPAPLPPRRDRSYSVFDMKKLDAKAGLGINAIVALTFGTGSKAGVFGASAILARGFTTTLYDAPVASSPSDGVTVTRKLSNLGKAEFSVDDNQPFPVYGWLEVSWDEPRR